MRKEFGDLLLVDAGDFFWSQDEQSELKADYTARAMKMIQYDAINVADGELGHGMAFLRRFHDSIQPAFISSNTFVHNEYAWKPYQIKRVNGFQVGVVGVVSKEFTDQSKTNAEGIDVRETATSLQTIVPGLRKEVSLVVLLSHAGWDESVRLANQVEGIDFIIVGHQYYYDFEPAVVNGTVLLKSSIGGKHVGVINVWLDRNGKIDRYESFLKELTSATTTDSEFLLLEKEFEKESKLAKKKASGRKK